MRRFAFIALLVAGSFAIAGCSSGSSSDLTKNPWQWTGSTTKVPASQTAVPDPTKYTLTFQSGGKVNIIADCNTIAGTYTQNGSSLTINTSGPSSLVACGPDSLDSIFLAELATVASYKTGSNPDLTLTFAADAGTMQFKAGS